jgi:hypothetical protein
LDVRSEGREHFRDVPDSERPIDATHRIKTAAHAKPPVEVVDTARTDT